MNASDYGRTNAVSIGMVLAILLSLWLTACATTTTTTATRNSYLSTWNAQLGQYSMEIAERKKIISSKAQEDIKPLLAASPDPWKTMVTRVFELSDMLRKLGMIGGKGELLNEFIKHMVTNPAPGLSDVWFAQRAENLKSEMQSVDDKTKTYFAAFDERIMEGVQWIEDVSMLAITQGYVIGKAEELKSLHSQALSYYGDMARAQAQDRYISEQRARAAGAIAAMGLYLGQLNYQQQLLNSLNRPRTCTSVGNTVVCN